MISLWMAPDWGAGKIWGLQPRSALVASGRQQILHLFYFFFKFVLLFYFIFCLFLAFFFFFPAIFCFSSRDPGSRCPCLLGAIFALPWELGIAARSCRSAWTGEKQHDTWQSRDWGRYFRGASKGELVPHRAPPSRPCLRAPKWPLRPSVPSSSLLRDEQSLGRPPSAFCELQLPACPARPQTCAFRRQHYITRQASGAATNQRASCWVVRESGVGFRGSERRGSGAEEAAQVTFPLGLPPLSRCRSWGPENGSVRRSVRRGRAAWAWGCGPSWWAPQGLRGWGAA